MPAPFQAKKLFLCVRNDGETIGFLILSGGLEREHRSLTYFMLKETSSMLDASSMRSFIMQCFSLQVCGLSSVIGQAYGRTSTKSLSRNYHLNSHNVKLHKASLRAEYFYSVFSIFVLNIEIG